jgi:membrane protease YdiL (CAAX protease family)
LANGIGDGLRSVIERRAQVSPLPPAGHPESSRYSSTATAQLVGPLRALAAGGGLEGSALARLTLSLGAGLYEELLFRVVIVALLANGFRLLFGASRLWSGVAATVIGALLFSAFHYVGPLGEPLRLESFVFRTLAGRAVSGLYMTRGFGITAWTHPL